MPYIPSVSISRVSKQTLAWFIKNLDLQIHDLSLETNNILINFYWDTADVTRAVLGMADFYSLDNIFNKTRFEGSQSLVLCLAGAGWIGPMKLLQPHQAEFLKSLRNEFNLTGSDLPLGGIDQFLRDSGLRDSKNEEIALSLQAFHLMSPSKRRDIVDRFAEEAELLFKCVQLVNGSWRTRLTSMYRQRVLDLTVGEEIAYSDLFKQPSFIAARTYFDSRRKERRVNNFTDATVLALLRQQVLAFNAGQSNALPRFFESSSLFREAAELSLQIGDLHYIGPDGRRECVLRDVDYYIFRAIFNPYRPSLVDTKDRANERSSLIERLRSIREEVSLLLGPSPPDSNVMLDIDIQADRVAEDLKQYRFLETVWLPSLAESAEMGGTNPYLRRLQELGGDDEFKGSVEDAVTGVRETLEKNAQEFKSASSLWRTLEAQTERFQKIMNSVPTETADMFKYLGFVRFGVPQLIKDQLQELLQKLITGNEEDTRQATSDIFHLCRQTRWARGEEQQRSLCVCLLWALELYNMIQERILTRSKEKTWLLAVNAASAIRLPNLINAEKAIDELKRRLRSASSRHEAGEITISLAYLCYQMWRAVGGQITWREDRPPSHEKLLVDNDRWSALACDYARQALDSTLRDHEGTLYALNLYIYYVTETGSSESFRYIRPLVNRLLHFKDNMEVWQFRYDDTLARYFHRLSTLDTDSDEKQEHLRIARKHIRNAAMDSFDDPHVTAYESLLANA